MKWTQVIDPFDNIALSALVALIPILYIFWALIIKKMKGYQASLSATLIAMIIAVIVYGMPVKLALLSTGHGILYGLFPICWIVLTAVFLFNITIKSGQFEVIKHFMASITSDRRLQALLIAFSFGSFLEGTAGFGAPVDSTPCMPPASASSRIPHPWRLVPLAFLLQLPRRFREYLKWPFLKWWEEPFRYYP